MARLEYYQSKLEQNVIPSLEETKAVIEKTINQLNTVAAPADLVANSAKLNEGLNSIKIRLVDMKEYVRESINKLNTIEYSMQDQITNFPKVKVPVRKPRVNVNVKLT